MVLNTETVTGTSFLHRQNQKYVSQIMLPKNIRISLYC